MEKVRTKVSFFLKDMPRNDGLYQLKARVRVYLFGKPHETFNIFVKDGANSIFLKKNQLSTNQISADHPQSIRYNELLKAIQKEIQSIVENELTENLILNIEIIRG